MKRIMMDYDMKKIETMINHKDYTEDHSLVWYLSKSIDSMIEARIQMIKCAIYSIFVQMMNFEPGNIEMNNFNMTVVDEEIGSLPSTMKKYEFKITIDLDDDPQYLKGTFYIDGSVFVELFAYHSNFIVREEDSIFIPNPRESIMNKLCRYEELGKYFNFFMNSCFIFTEDGENHLLIDLFILFKS
jgi:hypothetical protein